MWHRSLSSAWGILSKLVGRGRRLEHEELQLTVTFEAIGGRGLIWPIVVSGRSCRAWCDEVAWCQWIEPMISVPEFRAIDRELLAPLAQWSWSFVPPFMAGSALQVTVPEIGERDIDWDPVLTLERGEQKIAFRLLEWPENWLMEQVAEWGPIDSTPALPVVGLPLVLGWVYIAGSELLKLGPGDGLLLRGTADFAAGEAWLFHQRPLAKLNFLSPEEARVETIMKEHEQWPDSVQEVGAIMVTIVVEIGRWNLPLASVAQMSVGEIIRGDPSFEGEIRLTINGCTIGFATLLEVGGSWVARIEQLIGQWPFTSTVEDHSVKPPLVVEEEVGAKVPEMTSMPEAEVEAETEVEAEAGTEAEVETEVAGEAAHGGDHGESEIESALVAEASAEEFSEVAQVASKSDAESLPSAMKTAADGLEVVADSTVADSTVADSTVADSIAPLPDDNLAVKDGARSTVPRRRRAVSPTAATADKKSTKIGKPPARASQKRSSTPSARKAAKGDA